MSSQSGVILRAAFVAALTASLIFGAMAAKGHAVGAPSLAVAQDQ
jgi:hypothetical protein